MMNLTDPALRQGTFSCADAQPQKLQIIAVGKPAAVEQFVWLMNHIRFAKPYEWTAPQPSPTQPDEIMRTVTKQMRVGETTA